MTSNKKPGKPSSSAKNAAQPTTRRSARQERLARAGARDLRTAGTRGGTGSPSIVLWSGIAIVFGLVVIVAAIVLTQKPSSSPTNFTAPLANVTTPSDLPVSGLTLGKPDAPVTVDLYSDFRCTGCGSFVKNLEPKLVSDFVAAGKVKLVYHDYMIIDGDGTTASRDAANAARCAADEGKFWTYHDWLFANQAANEAASAFTIDRLIGIGKAAGIDSSTFESCVKQGTHNAEAAADMSSAPAALKAKPSTPTVFVAGKIVTSSLGANYLPTNDDIAKAINEATPASSSPATPAAASAS
jgi:protein-disulfide isomerase